MQAEIHTIAMDAMAAMPVGMCILAAPVQETGAEQLDRCRGLLRDGYSSFLIDGDTVKLTEQVSGVVADEVAVNIAEVEIGVSSTAHVLGSIEKAVRLGGGVMDLYTVDGKVLRFGRLLQCGGCETRIPILQPALFSLGVYEGKCSVCKGEGAIASIDPQLLVPDPTRTIAAGAIAPWSEINSEFFGGLLEEFCSRHGIEIDKEWNALTRNARNLILFGEDTGGFAGVVADMTRRLHRSQEQQGPDDRLRSFCKFRDCGSCKGSGFSAAARSFCIGDISIADAYACELAALQSLLERALSKEAGLSSAAVRLFRGISQDRASGTC